MQAKATFSEMDAKRSNTAPPQAHLTFSQLFFLNRKLNAACNPFNDCALIYVRSHRRPFSLLNVVAVQDLLVDVG